MKVFVFHVQLIFFKRSGKNFTLDMFNQNHVIQLKMNKLQIDAAVPLIATSPIGVWMRVSMEEWEAFVMGSGVPLSC